MATAAQKIGAGLDIDSAVTLNPTPLQAAKRVRVSLPARLTWKDASGAVRFASVTTRDISDSGVFVEPDGTAAAIPLYRLVHVQLEKDARAVHGIPDCLREGRVLAAVWRVGRCNRATGTPDGYALRFLVEPRTQGAGRPLTQMPVAS